MSKWSNTTIGFIVLVLIVVVAILYFLSMLGSGSGTTCASNVGFTCMKPVYDHTNGNIVVSVSQNSGQTWLSANFIFIPSNTQFNSENTLIILFGSNSSSAKYNVMGLNSGNAVNLNIKVSKPVNVGQSIVGTIWVQYKLQNSSKFDYVQVMSVNLKAS